MGRLVGVLEDDELELGAGQRHVSPCSAALSTCAWRIARGDCTTGRAVRPRQVALHHHRRRQVRQHPDRVRVEHELHVAVALLPRGDRVAVDGVHVDVDAEQVVAALGAVAEHLVEEVGAVQALALQPPLHVGERDDHGVDLPGVDPCRQLLHAQVAVVAHARSLIPAGRAAARPCRRSGAPSRAAPATASRARIASTIRACCASECSMFVGSTGIAVSISCRDACTDVTASISRREPVTVAIGEVEARVGLPVRGRRAGAGDRLVGPLQGPARGVGQVGAGRQLRPHPARPGAGTRARPASPAAATPYGAPNRGSGRSA